MNLTTVINCHSSKELIQDTVESVQTYATNNIIVLIDGARWHDFMDIDLPYVFLLEGFYHNINKSPFRNVALGLKTAYEKFPETDWFCYIEEDCLFTSDRFLNNLKLADEKEVWLLGNNGHVDSSILSVVNSIFGENLIKYSYYILGCCVFIKSDLIKKLIQEYDFFNKFLAMTSFCQDGSIPEFSGYDVSEQLYPTLVRYFKKNIGVFATWDYKRQVWHGAGNYFPMRDNPPFSENEIYPDASIIHPLKTYDHSMRKYFREKREKWKISV